MTGVYLFTAELEGKRLGGRHPDLHDRAPHRAAQYPTLPTAETRSSITSKHRISKATKRTIASSRRARSTCSWRSGTSRRCYLEGKSEKSARDTFFYYSGKDPSAVRYKNWKMYFAMVSDAPQGAIAGVVPYHWTQVVNIKRDPFETSIGQQYKTLFGQAGALGGPVTAYVYDWNLLPMGQALWLKNSRPTSSSRRCKIRPVTISSKSCSRSGK
jgi:hypothetical protein